MKEALQEKVPIDLSKAVAGGAVAAVITGIGVGTTGVASGAEARALLGSIQPSIRFLAASVVTASSTILALMLTLLSLGSQVGGELRRSHYERIRAVGSWSTIAIVLSIVLLLFLSVPTGESDVLANWYEPIYYGVVVTASVLGGIQVTVVLMLREALVGMVAAFHPGGESHLIASEEEDEEGEAA